MKRRVAIIGTGWVGASVAISTLHQGVADELLLDDTRREVAEGEAMDLAHGAAFYPPAIVRTAPIEEMADAAAVVVAAGRGGRPGESRLDLLRENARLSETSERDSVVVAPLQRMISDSALATPKSCGGQRRI
jgi:L-lactate dehydrogenase